MKYRHEWKHEIGYADMLAVRSRMSKIAESDAHALNGKYKIRSLYFDTLSDRALKEKIDGVNMREKFRLRYYNGDLSFIRLEKKTKINGLCLKESVPVNVETVRAISEGDFGKLLNSGEPLLDEFYTKIKCGLAPKTIVDYTREPFVFAPGNVRVTLDYDIRTGIKNTDFLNTDSVTVSVEDSPIILEVKWDEYLPDIIKDALQLKNCRVGAFSKYAVCRIYG